jgi:hypothetical protein
MALDDFLSARVPDLGEGATSWQRYLALPRKSQTEKMVAEVFRVLRILRIASIHRAGHAEWDEALARFSCTFGTCALSLNITDAGLALLERQTG